MYCTLKEIPVNQIEKIIELKDMIIVRYKNPLSKKSYYRIYNIEGELIKYGLYYSELLMEIRIIRNVNKTFNEILSRYFT